MMNIAWVAQIVVVVVLFFLLFVKVKSVPFIIPHFLALLNVIVCCACVFMLYRYCMDALFIEGREMCNAIAISSIKNHSFWGSASYPDTIYLYGCLQACLLSILPGSWDPVLLNRSAGWFFLLVSSAVMLLSVRKLEPFLGVQYGFVPLSLLWCFYMLPFLMGLPSSLGTPSYAGLLCSNVVLFCSLHKEKKWLILVPFFMLCCFLTKQYFIFCFVYLVLSCLLFGWCERGRILCVLIVSLLSVILLGLSFILMQVEYSFMHHVLMSAGKNMMLAVQKSTDFHLMRTPVWVLLGCYVLVNRCFSCRKCKRERRWHDYGPSNLSPYARCVCYLFVLTSVTLLVMSRMGQHEGCLGLIYYEQLETPVLTLCVACWLSRLNNNNWSYSLVLLLLLLVGGKRLHKTQTLPVFDQNQIQYITRDIEQGNVFGSALTSFIELPLQGKVSDHGQLCYMAWTYPSRGHNLGRLQSLRAQVQDYTKRLSDALSHRTYRSVYTDKYSLLADKPFRVLLEQNYKQERVIHLTEKESVIRWIPNRP